MQPHPFRFDYTLKDPEVPPDLGAATPVRDAVEVVVLLGRLLVLVRFPVAVLRFVGPRFVCSITHVVVVGNRRCEADSSAVS